MENTATVLEKSVDFFAPRTITLTRTIKGKEVEFIHKTGALSDKIWRDYNKTSNPRQVVENQKMIYKDDTDKATREAYKALVSEIPSGYALFFKQELTQENFADLIPFEDQQTVLAQVFAYDVNESEGQEFFFDDEGTVLVDVDIPVNGETQTCSISLNPKTKGAEKVYKEAMNPNFANVKRFRRAEIPASADIDKLCGLYKSLVYTELTLPQWIQVGVMEYYFVQYAQTEAKN